MNKQLHKCDSMHQINSCSTCVFFFHVLCFLKCISLLFIFSLTIVYAFAIYFMGCGSGFSLVPGYTTLSVRVRANINSVPDK